MSPGFHFIRRSAFVMSLLGGTPAWAQASAPIRWVLETDAHCPTEERFSSWLQQRAPELELVQTNGEEAEILVVLEQKGATATARADLEPPLGEGDVRVFAGEDCFRVAEALAASLAVALPDPLTVAEPARGRTRRETDEPEKEELSVGGRGASLRSSVQLASSAESLLREVWLVGGELSLSTRFEGGGWSPRFRASLLQEWSASFEGARFQLSAAAMELCPWETGTSWVFRFCAGARLGRLHARGAGDLPTESSSTFFWDGNASGRVLWKLSPDVALILGAALRATPVKRRYVFEQPRVELTETNHLFGQATLGMEIGW